jgi:hypothetical protein
VTYWPVPRSFRVPHAGDGVQMANLHALAALGEPAYAQQTLAQREREPAPGPRAKSVRRPEDRLLCFDYLFFGASPFSQLSTMLFC